MLTHRCPKKAGIQRRRQKQKSDLYEPNVKREQDNGGGMTCRPKSKQQRRRRVDNENRLLIMSQVRSSNRRLLQVPGTKATKRKDERREDDQRSKCGTSCYCAGKISSKGASASKSSFYNAPVTPRSNENELALEGSFSRTPSTLANKESAESGVPAKRNGVKKKKREKQGKNPQ